jgi:hypothetical protein
MEFQEIDDNNSVFPGEYLLYIPRQKIVVCGAYKKKEGKIRALCDGRLVEDNISNFKKVMLDKEERKTRTTRSCGGCKGR